MNSGVFLGGRTSSLFEIY